MVKLFSMFSNRSREPDDRNEETYAPAPGTGIRYSPDLIGELIADHKRLFDSYNAIKDAHRSGDMGGIPQHIDDFNAILTGHLLTEQIRLYAYMNAYFADDERTAGMIRDYRKEMDRIGDTATKVLKKYRGIASDAALLDGFEADFDKLGEVLRERMSREEKVLYPLYMPVIETR